MTSSEFFKRMYGMYGYDTRVVTDSINNRYNYSSGEVDDELLEPFEGSDDIVEETLDENSTVTAAMLINFSVETAPAENTQDDEYINVIRSMFSETSRLYSVEKDEVTTYILWYE